MYLDKTRLIIVIGQENILFRFVPGDISMLSTDLPYDMSQMCITWQVQALSSPDPKGHVSFCHHLVFIHLSVNFLHFDHHLWNNLTQTLKVDYKKIPYFVSIRGKTWPPWVILVSDWLNGFESSPLKLQVQIIC
jgi:hypothetical protein